MCLRNFLPGFINVNAIPVIGGQRFNNTHTDTLLKIDWIQKL